MTNRLPVPDIPLTAGYSQDSGKEWNQMGSPRSN